jgi:hypothetical protein
VAACLSPDGRIDLVALGVDIVVGQPSRMVGEWVRKYTPSNAEGIFIAGNGFRPIGVIAALEEDLGRPVLTANQVALWHALRLAGAGTQVDDYGQVFTKRPVPGGIAPHIRPIPNGPGSAIARAALSFC